MRGWQLPEYLVAGVTCHKGKQGYSKRPVFCSELEKEHFSLCLFAFTYSKVQVFVRAGF